MSLTVVTAAPPTPNGDLHLGHVSGPYLGADVLARAERAAGRDAVLVTGSDVNQSYTAVKARELGRDPYEMAAGFADDIDAVFAAARIRPDACPRPQDSPRHRELVAEFVGALAERGALVERDRPALHCPRCQRYLFEGWVAGDCPHCGADSDGNSCEACARPNDVVDLGRPRCNLCGTTPVLRSVRQLCFPVEKYAARLADRLDETACGVGLDALRRELLAGPLPDVPVGHPTDWGLPVPGHPDQRLYVWVEMVPGYLAGIEAATGRPWRSVWDAPGTRVVQFFGFDNGWFHSVLHPCLLLAYDEHLRLPAALVANEFLQLDGSKFSTSRRHAVWAREFVEEVGADTTRFVLSWLRPEAGPTNFDRAALAAIVDGELTGRWEPWIDGLAPRLTTRPPAPAATGPGADPAGAAPTTAAPTAAPGPTAPGPTAPGPTAAGPVGAREVALGRHVQRFEAELARLTGATRRAYAPDGFSPARAARLLGEWVRVATDFRRAAERVEAGSPHPAVVAAEAAAVRRFAELAAPLVPDLADRLLTGETEPSPRTETR